PPRRSLGRLPFVSRSSLRRPGFVRPAPAPGLRRWLRADQPRAPILSGCGSDGKIVVLDWVLGPPRLEPGAAVVLVCGAKCRFRRGASVRFRTDRRTPLCFQGYFAPQTSTSLRRPLDALVGQCWRPDALSAVEHRPAD